MRANHRPKSIQYIVQNYGPERPFVLGVFDHFPSYNEMKDALFSHPHYKRYLDKVKEDLGEDEKETYIVYPHPGRRSTKTEPRVFCIRSEAGLSSFLAEIIVYHKVNTHYKVGDSLP